MNDSQWFVWAVSDFRLDGDILILIIIVDKPKSGRKLDEWYKFTFTPTNDIENHKN